MRAWARANFSQAEKDAYERAVRSQDHYATLFALQGLRARYEAANGKTPTLISGDGPGGSDVGFASVYEMQKAMRDPRYGKDSAYTKQVEQRTMKSTFR